MIIGVVGLGLIGGSFAKSLKKRTNHSVWGTDLQPSVLREALRQKAIDAELSADKIERCDVLVLALYPGQAIEFVRRNSSRIRKKSVVVDFCGVKTAVGRELEPLAEEFGFYYLGAHPMAGREFSGFDYSTDSLFCDAPLILTPSERTPDSAVSSIETLARQVGFASVPTTSPENHDRIIAFTSQLAHIVSSAFVKSPTAAEHFGFSAGSYKDLTRVARLNEKMWTELFLDNKDNLLTEIERLIARLTEYRTAIQSEDRESLSNLLKEGRERKEAIDKNS